MRRSTWPNTRAAVLVPLLLLANCHKKPAPPGPGVQTFVVQDFEDSVSVTKWPKDHVGNVDLSSEWKASGAQSLKIDPGLLAYTKDLDLSDWSAFQVLRLTVHNPGDRSVVIGFELQDDHDDFYDRH